MKYLTKISIPITSKNSNVCLFLDPIQYRIKSWIFADTIFAVPHSPSEQKFIVTCSTNNIHIQLSSDNLVTQKFRKCIPSTLRGYAIKQWKSQLQTRKIYPNLLSNRLSYIVSFSRNLLNSPKHMCHATKCRPHPHINVNQTIALFCSYISWNSLTLSHQFAKNETLTSMPSLKFPYKLINDIANKKG